MCLLDCAVHGVGNWVFNGTFSTDRLHHAVTMVVPFPFSALTQLVIQQEGHPAWKKARCVLISALQVL